jgi:hypothetical protein
MPKPPKAPPPPLTDANILEALAASGYPLELHLRHQLEDAGWHVSLGRRVPLAEGTREFDLIVTKSRDVWLGTYRVRVGVHLLIEVKKLHKPLAFVGIHGRRPLAPIHGWIRLGGVPSLRSLSATDGAPYYRTEFAELFADLEAPVSCPHWAVVRPDESKSPPFVASGNSELYGDLAGLAEGQNLLMDVLSRRVVESDKQETSVVLSVAMLVLDADRFVLYDSDQDLLVDSERALIQQSFEVDGSGHSASIEVVSAPGIIRAAERWDAALGKLASWIDANKNTFSVVAEGLKKNAREEMERRALERA